MAKVNSQIPELEIHIDWWLGKKTTEIVNQLSEIARNALVELWIDNPDLSNQVSIAESNTSNGNPYSLHFTYKWSDWTREVETRLDEETGQWISRFKGLIEVLQWM